MEEGKEEKRMRQNRRQRSLKGKSRMCLREAPERGRKRDESRKAIAAQSAEEVFSLELLKPITFNA